MRQQLPGGIRCVPLAFETLRFEADSTHLANLALIAFKGGYRSWNNVARTIKKKLDIDTIECLRTGNIPLQDTSRPNHDDYDKDVLLWAYFTDKASRDQAIMCSLKPRVPFTVLPMLEKTATYYAFVMDDLPMYSEESATRWISNAFDFSSVQKDLTWFLYFGRTDPPLETYNGSATVIIRGDMDKDKTVIVYDRPVRAHGPYYLYCPHCKLLNDHDPNTCPKQKKNNPQNQRIRTKKK